MTVSELIALLKPQPPERLIRVRAACCSHPHDIRGVREIGDDDADDKDAPIVIDANE